MGTDTVHLYTNIQAPGSKAFWKEHGESITGLNGAAASFPNASTVTVSNFGTSGAVRKLYTTDTQPPGITIGAGTYERLFNKSTFNRGHLRRLFWHESQCDIPLTSDNEFRRYYRGFDLLRRLDLQGKPDCLSAAASRRNRIPSSSTSASGHSTRRIQLRHGSQCVRFRFRFWWRPK